MEEFFIESFTEIIFFLVAFKKVFHKAKQDFKNTLWCCYWIVRAVVSTAYTKLICHLFFFFFRSKFVSMISCKVLYL